MKQNHEKFCDLCSKSLGFAWFAEGSTRDTISISVGGTRIHICEDCYDEYTAKALQAINEIRLSHCTKKQVPSKTSKKQRNPRKAVAG